MPDPLEAVLYPPPPQSEALIASGVDRYLFEFTEHSKVHFHYLNRLRALEGPTFSSNAANRTGTENPKGEHLARENKRRLLKPALLLLGYIKETLRLRTHFKQGPIKELIHVNRVGCEVQPIAARLAGYRKVVTTVHNLPGEDNTAKQWVCRLVEYLSFRCADHHICVSEATYQAWKQRIGLKRHKVSIIHNGMSPPDYSDFNRDDYRKRLLADRSEAVWIGICARLHPMKGHTVLLRAFGEMLTQISDRVVVLIIAGTGPLEQALKNEADELGLSKHVVFLGHRTDALEFARAIDISVLPSIHSETLGYSLIEAMFAECPSVVSDVGGMKELVKASGGGKVVPARRISELAQALAVYVANPELARRDGLRAGEYARQHLSADTMAQKTEEAYQNLFSQA